MSAYQYIEDGIYRVTNRLFGMPPIYINAYVSKGSKNRNWGDDINYWFLKELIKSPIRLYNNSPLGFRNRDSNYLVIGSTINLLTKSSSIIWGAGCISNKIPIPAVPQKVLAVRGPLTRNYLLSIGIECPDVYGDPALLIPRYYRPTIVKRYKLGLINHVSTSPLYLPGAKMISMAKYENWHQVIDQILACEVIASSSLHGLIMAEAYGIPNVWLAAPGLIGGTFKFYDFYASLGVMNIKPVYVNSSMTAHDLIDLASYYGGNDFDLKPLLEVAPFEIRQS